MRVLWKVLGTVLVTYIPQGPTSKTSSSGMLTSFCWGRARAGGRVGCGSPACPSLTQLR